MGIMPKYSSQRIIFSNGQTCFLIPSQKLYILLAIIGGNVHFTNLTTWFTRCFQWGLSSKYGKYIIWSLSNRINLLTQYNCLIYILSSENIEAITRIILEAYVLVGLQSKIMLQNTPSFLLWGWAFLLSNSWYQEQLGLLMDILFVFFFSINCIYLSNH